MSLFKSMTDLRCYLILFFNSTSLKCNFKKNVAANAKKVLAPAGVPFALETFLHVSSDQQLSSACVPLIPLQWSSFSVNIKNCCAVCLSTFRRVRLREALLISFGDQLRDEVFLLSNLTHAFVASSHESSMIPCEERPPAT